MKRFLPAVGMALLLAAGCQDAKTPSESNAIDVTTPVAATATPAPVTALPAAESNPTPINAAVAPASNTYTVQPGDTLWKIAATHYGDGKKWQQIVDANPGLTPSKLRIGEKITLP